MSLYRTRESRNSWKNLARERRCACILLKRKLDRRDKEVTKLRAESATLKNELTLAQETLKARIEAENKAPIAQAQVRVICVMLFIQGVISCNAVSRVLAILASIQGNLLKRQPHPSSVVNWIARAGLGMLQGIQPINTPWIAIIDTSISYGKAKLLVCLRVPLASLSKSGHAIGLGDVECVGLEIREKWDGAAVCETLLNFFKKCGNPVAILKDGGTDLKLGTELLQKQIPGIRTISDIGHIVANALKAAYSSTPAYKRFLELVDNARARLTNSEISCLRPPKIRTKGRFQGISRIVKWAQKMAALTAGRGQPHAGSLKDRLRKIMPKISSMRSFFSTFSRNCEVLNDLQAILKNAGLNQKSYAECMKIINKLSKSSKIRKKIECWLKTTLRTQCALSIGQTPLPVSSDVIESLFGLIKALLGRQPSPEFGVLTLSIPLLCGKHSESDIMNYLDRCPVKVLSEWKTKNLSNTNRRVKSRVLGKTRRAAELKTRRPR